MVEVSQWDPGSGTGAAAEPNGGYTRADGCLPVHWPVQRTDL